MSIGMGGADDVYNVSVNVDMAAAVPQFNQFQNAVNNTSSQFVNLNRNITITHQSSQSLMGSMTGLIGTAAGIGILVRTVRELTGAFAEATKEASGLGADTSKWQRSLRELQTAGGRAEPLSDEVKATNIRLMRAGLTEKQAFSAQRTFAGEAAVGLEPGPGGAPPLLGKDKASATQKYNQVMERIGQVAVAMGGDPDEFMKLAGRYAIMYPMMSVDGIVELTVSTMKRLGFAPGQTTQLLGQFTNALTTNVFAGPGGNVDSPDKLAGLMFGVATGLPTGRVGTATSIVAGAVMGVTRGSKKFEENIKNLKGFREDMDAVDKIVLVAEQARKDMKMDEGEFRAAIADMAEMEEEGGEAKTPGGKRAMKYFADAGLASAPSIRALSAITANLPRMKTVLASPVQKAKGPGGIDEDIEKTMAGPEMQNQLANTREQAEKLLEGERYQIMNNMLQFAKGSLRASGRDTPEMRAPEAMTNFLNARGLTGMPDESMRKLHVQSVQEWVNRYGGDVDHPMFADKTATVDEIEQAYREGTIAPAMAASEERRKRRGKFAGAAGLTVEDYDRTPGTLEAAGETPAETFLPPLPGGGLGTMATEQGGAILSMGISLLNRLVGNTEPLRDNVPLPQNAPDPKR